MLRVQPCDCSTRMTRSRCGSLRLHRTALSSAPPRRFIPAHSQICSQIFGAYRYLDGAPNSEACENRTHASTLAPAWLARAIRKYMRRVRLARDGAVPGPPVHLRTSRSRGCPQFLGRILAVLPRRSCCQPSSLYNRALAPTCDQLGLPRVSWHPFRHANGTWVGDSVKTVQSILGHTDL